MLVATYFVAGLCFMVCGVIHLWPEIRRDYRAGILRGWRGGLVVLILAGVLLFGWWAIVASWLWREFVAGRGR